MTDITLIDAAEQRVLARHVHVETNEPEPKSVMDAAAALLEAVENYRQAKIDADIAHGLVAEWWARVDERRIALAEGLARGAK